MKPRQPPRNRGKVPIPERCGGSFLSLRHVYTAEVSPWELAALNCRECGAEYELDASYVCDRCFGPLEVAYDHTGLTTDVGEIRRRIQGGPAEHLALCRLPAARRAGSPVRPVARPRAPACPPAARR